ncbi:DNA methyltransferase [Bacillus haynesii]|uniref:DNA methyltransferase n=1 Tax=Bacillus haynesii TaxID=1925021 RepID=UPI002280FF88|nr:DNA methyltransferase [Bacillus haynesii]MCY7990738.1 TetR family transcriptional regulator [Bacillus haynesii]
MKKASQHAEWLSLIEVSGPFLAISMLEKAFPQGLESVEAFKRQRLRSAYEEWVEAVEKEDKQLSELHYEWIQLVLREILEYDDECLASNNVLDASYRVTSPEQAGSFTPDLIIHGVEDRKPRLFISIQNPDVEFESIQNNDGWVASLVERMTVLCRSNDVRLGIITNGERWMLVNAPIGKTSSHVSWYARLWLQEPVTLKAFQSLLGIRRCFGPPDETLEILLEESLEHQDDVTNTLGEQVRRAVEVLVQSLDKADEDRNRELLTNVTPEELYEAGLTVMMRLVFILCAEERGLLLLGDSTYDQHYAVTTLRSQLAEEMDHHGPEVLERRQDAWSRLLAIFRAVYAGVEQESLSMPALGGSLFNPDRFPFLEGRKKGTNWLETIAEPLPIDNRTVLLLLDSLQVLEQPGGALLLSYRALDVEQIGHVYEGLLEHKVIRVPKVTLGLIGSQKTKNPSISLSELESAHLDGEEILITFLKELTQRSESAIRKAIERPVSERLFERLVVVCGGDFELAARISPFANLLRTDAWDNPIVYQANAFMVTIGAGRRETGTHYTPKSLAEQVVVNTLEPLVYVGPADGKLRQEWQLKTPNEILNLKVCDPAMGSGAFLVQVCRWLAERLVEAWAIEEENGRAITSEGKLVDYIGSVDPMPSQLDERLLIARRLIAERCLYGVDINLMAVELAKLSIWLITLAKGRPFDFLDHNLRYGDSLLGIHSLRQLTELSVNTVGENQQLHIFGQMTNKVVAEAIELRKNLREMSIHNIRDIETMVRLNKEAQEKLSDIELLADALVGEVLSSGTNPRTLKNSLDSLAADIPHFLSGEERVRTFVTNRANGNLLLESPSGKFSRKPFHWPLEFPEVFTGENGGFDAIVGNPPFLGGRRMRGILGDEMMHWFTICWPHASLNADLSAFFYLRASLLIRSGGEFGLLATNTIAQGDTARTGLLYLGEKQNFTIRYALPSFKWPGTAAVVASLVIGHKGSWKGSKYLDNCRVEFISPVLDDQNGWGEANQLLENKDKSFQGSVLVGKGFILKPEEVHLYTKERQANQDIIFPYLSGDDINSHPKQEASRWVIDFRDRGLEECQENWPELLGRIRSLVKPQRDKTRREAHRRYWWHHGDKRPALYERIQNRKEVFVLARVTKYVAIVSVPARQVFNDMVYVFDLPNWSSFAALQCSFHDLWVRRGSSTVGETLRYTPSDYFDTYPFSHANSIDLEKIGHKYHSIRGGIMEHWDIGLTSIYNQFHNPDESAEEIQKLRDIHTDMDYAVASAYGWSDLNLEHGFYNTKQGVRFTVSEGIRREVLNRLLKLNQEYYEKEVMQMTQKKGKSKKRRSQKNAALDQQLDIFS